MYAAGTPESERIGENKMFMHVVQKLKLKRESKSYT
jgi:hypothetical protein